MDTRLISEKIKDRILTTTLIQTVYFEEKNHSNGTNFENIQESVFNDIKWPDLAKRESNIMKKQLYTLSFLHESKTGINL